MPRTSKRVKLVVRTLTPEGVELLQNADDLLRASSERG